MDTGNTQNNILIDEYISNLSKSLHDKTLELILANSKLNVANKEKGSIQQLLLEKTQEVDSFRQANETLQEELEAETKNVKTVEVEKVVEKIIEKSVSTDDYKKLEAVNSKLLKELDQSDKRIQEYKNKLSQTIEEQTDGDNNKAEAKRSS
jgi:uncharacterized protein YdiU (UPF0061 family)